MHCEKRFQALLLGYHDNEQTSFIKQNLKDCLIEVTGLVGQVESWHENKAFQEIYLQGSILSKFELSFLYRSFTIDLRISLQLKSSFVFQMNESLRTAIRCFSARFTSSENSFELQMIFKD